MRIGNDFSSPSDSSPHTLEQIDDNDISFNFADSSKVSKPPLLSKTLSIEIDVENKVNTPKRYKHVTKAPKKLGSQRLNEEIRIPIVLNQTDNFSKTASSRYCEKSLNTAPSPFNSCQKKDSLVKEKVMQAKRKILASRNTKGSKSQKIPKPSFHKFNLNEDMGIPDSYDRYDNWVPFIRPEGHYLRLTETFPESEESVEYDLDLEDKAWIEAYYNDVPLEQLPFETIMAFEFTIDRLEKEWFYLTRNIEASTRTEQSIQNTDDIPCEICGEVDCENSNAIVFCDGCDLAVHQECYGVPFIPEGQWLCRKCMLSPSNPVKCVLCPNEGGAFKQTSSNSWAHLTCALWIPEVSFGNITYMEPIEGVNKIPKSRKKLVCFLCKRQSGACIQCAFKTCSESFHVTCAKISNLCMQYKLNKGSVSMRAYCNKHTPKDYKKQIDIEATRKIADKKADSSITKSALAHSHTISSSKPIITQTIYDSVHNGIVKFKIRRCTDFFNNICKYWSLKKESCRGALLIKRLHLEPWTACHKVLQTEEEKVAVYGVLKKVRTDLERVRMLAELVRKREACRLHILCITQQYWEIHFFPQTPILRDTLNRMIQLDTHEFFLLPVSKELVPDYYDFIKSPMDLGTLSKLVNNHEIVNLNQFKEKLLLIYNNCQLYNSKITQYYKVATRHIKKAHEFLASAANQIAQLNVDPKSGFLLPKFDPNSCFTNDLPNTFSLELNCSPSSTNSSIDNDLEESEILDVLNPSDSEVSICSSTVNQAIDSKSYNKRISLLNDGLSSSSDDSTLETPPKKFQNSNSKKSKKSKLSLETLHNKRYKKEDPKQTSILSFLPKAPTKRSRISRVLRAPERYSP